MSKNERIAKMSGLVATFPSWALENLAHHMRQGTKVLCGPGLPALLPSGEGCLALLVGIREVPQVSLDDDKAVAAVYSQGYEGLCRLRAEGVSMDWLDLLEEMEPGEAEEAIWAALKRRKQVFWNGGMN